MSKPAAPRNSLVDRDCFCTAEVYQRPIRVLRKRLVRPILTPDRRSLSATTRFDVQFCRGGVWGVPYTLPAKLPGEGVLNATHPKRLNTLEIRGVSSRGKQRVLGFFVPVPSHGSQHQAILVTVSRIILVESAY